MINLIILSDARKVQNCIALIPGGNHGAPSRRDRKETAKISITMRGRVKITATAEVRAAVIAGIGLAIVPERSFTPELKSGAVVLAMDEWLL